MIAPMLIVIGGAVAASLLIRRLYSLSAKSKPKARHLFQRITLIGIAGIALFVAGSSGINAILLQVNRRKLPGRIYVVHGRRMRIDCTGEGSPTIVPEAGGGNDGAEFSRFWRRRRGCAPMIVPALAEVTLHRLRAMRITPPRNCTDCCRRRESSFLWF